MDGAPSDFTDAIFARRLKDLRKQAEVTQQQLADRLAELGIRIHRSAIAKIEAGDRPVSIGEAVQLAGVLGADLRDLVTDPATDSRQEREYRQLVDARIAVRSLQHEAAERYKLMEEAGFLYQNTVDRLTAAQQRLEALELRLKVRDQQAQFPQSAQWIQPDIAKSLAERSEPLSPPEEAK